MEGLHKYTDENKVSAVLSLKKIEKEDVLKLTNVERSELLETITNHLNTSEGEQYDEYCEKYANIISETSRNMIWEVNHNKIVKAINNHIQEYGSMPNKSKIAELSKLSRATVYKHLSEYKTNELYKSYIDQFEIMRNKVLGGILKTAINGDIKAARLFYDIIDKNNHNKEVITIHGCTINIQILNTLSTEKLNLLLDKMLNLKKRPE